MIFPTGNRDRTLSVSRHWRRSALNSMRGRRSEKREKEMLNQDFSEFIALSNDNHGYPPNRIDILLQASGIDFAECCRQRLRVLLDKVEVDFIDLEDLKKNKQATGRTSDLADLENLQ